MSDIKDDDEAYLVVDEAHMKKVILPDEVWAKIDDKGNLEFVRWDLIERFAREYDATENNRSQNHVFCKLLTLVRDQTRRECEQL